MRDDISIGCSPFGEDCVQIGQDDYLPRARRECAAFIHQIRRAQGHEPDGAYLKIKSNPHDFGSYLDVVCVYDDANEAAVEYAFACECSKALEFWDAQARAELGITIAKAA